MSDAVPYNITPRGVTVYVNDEIHTLGPDHPGFEAVKDAIRNREWDKIADLVDVGAAIEAFGEGKLTVDVEAGEVRYDEKPLPRAVEDKILSMMREGFDIKPLANFLDRVNENPSASARRELILFCEANNFVIDEGGYVVAFKGVRDNYRDSYSGRFDNSIGQVVEMDRGDVDDRRDVTCSFGLHFGALEYAKWIGQRTMVVRIDPNDVVSIPRDYNNQKGRCCRYEVVGEIARGREERHLPPRGVVDASSDYQKDYGDPAARDVNAGYREEPTCAECGAALYGDELDDVCWDCEESDEAGYGC